MIIKLKACFVEIELNKITFQQNFNIILSLQDTKEIFILTTNYNQIQTATLLTIFFLTHFSFSSTLQLINKCFSPLPHSKKFFNQLSQNRIPGPSLCLYLCLFLSVPVSVSLCFSLSLQYSPKYDFSSHDLWASMHLTAHSLSLNDGQSVSHGSFHNIHIFFQ